MLPVATLLWPLFVFWVSYHKSDGHFLAELYVGKAPPSTFRTIVSVTVRCFVSTNIEDY